MQHASKLIDKDESHERATCSFGWEKKCLALANVSTIIQLLFQGGEKYNIDEETMISLFDPGYRAKISTAVPTHVVELTYLPPELRATVRTSPPETTMKSQGSPSQVGIMVLVLTKAEDRCSTLRRDRWDQKSSCLGSFPPPPPPHQPPLPQISCFSSPPCCRR